MCLARGLKNPAFCALFLTFVVGLLGCKPAPESRSDTPASGAADDAIVARVEGQSITQGQLDTWLKEDLWKRKLEEAGDAGLYDLRMEGLERMLDERLVGEAAEKKGISSPALLEQTTAAVAIPTDEAVRLFYDQNRDRLGKTSFEELTPRIRSYLQQKQREAARQEFTRGLHEKAAVEIKLEPPRQEIAALGPALGPDNAPITIIEFSDYQCPFCRRAEPTVKKVLERYGDRVRFIYRNYPLSFHSRARPAAEAALCAKDQGHFWEYHEKLFSDAGELSDADFERMADAVGLEISTFKACLSKHAFEAEIEADIRAGSQAGVDGTPAFFVNGIRLSGAQPIEKFVTLIDAELARGGKSGS